MSQLRHMNKEKCIATHTNRTFKPDARPKDTHTWLLEIVFVHVSVCVSAPKGISNQWCDISRL